MKQKIQVSDLVIGDEYRTFSGLGGSFTIRYDGVVESLHVFHVITPEWEEIGPFSFTDDQVERRVWKHE